MLQTTAVTLPIFAPISAQPSISSASGSAPDFRDESGVPVSGVRLGEGWQMESNNANDTMDFDLLAEYLLDDSPGGANGVPFDFNGASSGDGVANAPASVVSPGQSEDGVMPLVAEGALVGGAVVAQPQAATFIQHQPAAPLLTQQMVATSSAVAPSLFASQSSAPAQAFISPSFAMHSGGLLAAAIAPAPGNAVSSVPSAVVPQQITATKRRRIDESALSDAPSQLSPVLNDPIAVAAALQGRGRKKTQAQIDRRRERNRILARRTRLRKKFFFESLQKEVMDLQRENSALKDIVRGQLNSEEGRRLLDECDAAEKLPSAVIEACGEQASDMDQQDFNLVKSIQQSQHCFVITDPSLQDNPIVFASDDFLSLTGYSREDVLGRNCRFLQGTNTSESKVAEIRKGIACGDDVSVTLVNYTADGTPFWNKLFIAALRDAQNNIVNFIGVIVKVASPEPDDPEYGKVLSGQNSESNADVYAPSGSINMDSDMAVMVGDGIAQTVDGADAASATAMGTHG